MPSGTAKFARHANGLSHFAEVALEIEFVPGSTDIRCDCDGAGFIGQGYLEDVPASGYDSWKAGARAGVAFALAVAALPPARVTIGRISGLTTDTNPTVVGVAAALALWRAVGFSPSADVVARLDGAALTSWSRDPDEIPTFG
jgi:hypothetical protein